MLFWIFVIIAVIGAIILWFTKDDCGYGFDTNTFGMVLFWIGVVAIGISCLIFIFEYCCTEAYIAEKQVEYESLVYQYENDFYDNDNDLGKRELMTDIQTWNEFVAYYSKVQDSFWFGIYYANIYDRFEFIELERVTVE